MCSIRQLEERLLQNEVLLMQWSMVMDLLAIANAKGELALHRLNWQRVWVLSPPEEGDKITNIAWKPDGKIIAVTYANSKLLCLIDIENKNIVNKIKLKSDELCTCIAWLSLSTPSNNSDDTETPAPSSTGEYLPPLPSLNRSYGQEPEKKEFTSQVLDMIFLGQENGKVMMYIFGMFYCGSLTVGTGPVLEVSGGAGEALWISWRNNESVNVVRLSSPLISNCEEFLNFAQIQAHIDCLMDYLSRTLMAICESWETILLEMDEKLAKYAADKKPGTVAADFLELLMMGTPSPDLVSFLLRDLTEKGLKKLGQSIEMCYSNIQKLVLNHLNHVGMALVYHLAEMRGMVRFGGAYAALGLKEDTPITAAVSATQTFLAKSSEVQQIIDQSLRDYKAFIKWLYTVILRLNDERIPTEMSKVSQQDLTYISEFLRGFDKVEIHASKRKGVNLERLGQYLREEPLQSCFSPEGSEWASMLVENQCLKNHSLIIKQDFQSSLLQEHLKLTKAINNVFDCAYQDLVHRFDEKIFPLLSTTFTSSSQFVTNDGKLLLAVPNLDRKILYLYKIKFTSMEKPLAAQHIRIDLAINSPAKREEQIVLDLQFYSQDFLSLLILNIEKCTSCFIQLPLNHPILSNQSNTQDLALNLQDLANPNLTKVFQDDSPRIINVSGPRKVAAVLSESRRKIKLLETEVDPEEDEDLGDDCMMDTSTAPSTS
ncbi:hypothetical protein QAD02_012111 [Eretmocerus hayati]|uniref:Uncharacterized protein n=1 Tax=Eretmocerus hayati TaxID=131215 RepID=A0ACC2P1C3_9HYME|nr:hypothetical protein QAD02_012111 [Eretmocerus hayati]